MRVPTTAVGGPQRVNGFVPVSRVTAEEHSDEAGGSTDTRTPTTTTTDDSPGSLRSPDGPTRDLLADTELLTAPRLALPFGVSLATEGDS